VVGVIGHFGGKRPCSPDYKSRTSRISFLRVH
jgi:hypothetical protein